MTMLTAIKPAGISEAVPTSSPATTLAQEFADLGYLRPRRILDGEQCVRFMSACQEARRTPPLDWSKGQAPTSRAFFEIAAHPAIMQTVTALLGEDVILWGASMSNRLPGAAHPWHSDIESCHPKSRTVSVWISIAHSGAESAMMVIPRSHTFGVSIQEMRQQRAVERNKTTLDNVLQWAREHDPRCEIVAPVMQPGEALFFDGRLWHGSKNETNQMRQALLLQYATPDTLMRLPDLNQLDWPFRYIEYPRPACLVLNGSDRFGINRIVRPPLAPDWVAKMNLGSRIHPVTLPLPAPARSEDWKPFPLFHGTTADLQDLTCHISSLKPGKCPHPPHRHIEEELLMCLHGEVDVILPDTAGVSGNDRHRLRTGEFVYYPANFAHTLETVGNEPANYLMFKWRTDSIEPGKPLPFGKYDLNAPASAASQHDISPGYRLGNLLTGPTRHLHKLHCHVSTLAPGAGYPPHVDGYDVAIIVLEGEVETLGQRVAPHGVIFYAAGEPHGMSNPGSIPSRYVVFEFHGSRAAMPNALPDPESLLRKLRDPQRWKNKAKHVLKRLRG